MVGYAAQRLPRSLIEATMVANPMCRFSVQESSQLQKAVSSLLAKKERYRVTQDLPE